MNQTSFHPQKILRTVSIGLHIKKDVTSSFEIVASAAAVLHRPAHRPDPTAYRQFRRENLMGKSVQKDKNTFKHSSSKRVEVDEDAFREMLLGQELPARDVAQNDPKQDDAEPTIRNKTVDSKAEPPVPAAGTIPADSRTTPDRSGFQRKKILLPDFEQTFFRPVKCSDGQAAIYVSLETKHKISKLLHLLGNERTRLTALVDNMLQFVIGIYSDELNYLHEKKNNRRPF